MRLSRQQAAALGIGTGSAATKRGGGGAGKATIAASLVAGYCRAQGYPEPVPEYEFHPSRKWRFDLCWPSLMLAVEFQGGSWTGGRHTRPKGFADDCEKFGEAAVMGWRVLPVTYAQVRAGLLWAWLDRLMGALGGSAATPDAEEGR